MEICGPYRSDFARCKLVGERRRYFEREPARNDFVDWPERAVGPRIEGQNRDANLVAERAGRYGELDFSSADRDDAALGADEVAWSTDASVANAVATFAIARLPALHRASAVEADQRVGAFGSVEAGVTAACVAAPVTTHNGELAVGELDGFGAGAARACLLVHAI